jgi:hypothetical protein
MIAILLVCMSLITIQQPPQTADDPKPSVDSQKNEQQAAALAEYNALKGKVAETGAAHWKLALWCEQKGLRPEAYFHFGRVIELEPKRDAAWQKLGFKKHDGRWMTAEQIAIEESQKKADKDWSVKLKKWHKEIHGGKKQLEVQALLDAITDPTAVPSIYREFCGGGPTDQSIGLQLLGQIDGVVASKTIAVLAIYGKTPEVRRHATELLRGRPTDEFLDMLVSLMKDLLNYEVKPVGGPGSPGILFVEGERFNARLFYAPPPPPTYVPRFGDTISYDLNGLPVVTRTHVSTQALGPKVGVPGSKTLVTQREAETTTTDTFSFANAMNEAQRAAQSAQAQLAGDVAQIESINETFKKFNEHVMAIAQAATGKSPGKTAKDWRDLLAKGKDGRYNPRPTPPAMKPTIDEVVPLSYLPDLSAMVMRQSQTRFLTATQVDT